jgi:hypothetical protein
MDASVEMVEECKPLCTDDQFGVLPGGSGTPGGPAVAQSVSLSVGIMPESKELATVYDSEYTMTEELQDVRLVSLVLRFSIDSKDWGHAFQSVRNIDDNVLGSDDSVLLLAALADKSVSLLGLIKEYRRTAVRISDLRYQQTLAELGVLLPDIANIVMQCTWVVTSAELDHFIDIEKYVGAAYTALVEVQNEDPMVVHYHCCCCICSFVGCVSRSSSFLALRGSLFANSGRP